MNQVKTHATEVQKKTEPARQLEQEATRQPEQGVVQVVAPQAAYRRAQVSRNGLRPADLLALQRTVGNRQVQRILERSSSRVNGQQQKDPAQEDCAIRVQTKFSAKAFEGIHKHRVDHLEYASAPDETISRTITVAPSSSQSTTGTGKLGNRQLIEKALQSEKPSDVKRIDNFDSASNEDIAKLINIVLAQRWVGPGDERVLERIWGSLDDTQLIKFGSEHIDLWQKCLNRGAELDDLPAVKRLENQFKGDIKEVVTDYLFQNRLVVLKQMENLGIPQYQGVTLPTSTKEQADKIKKIQKGAEAVAKLQKAQEEARHTYVGYEVVTKIQPGGRSSVSYWSPVTFNPYSPPQYGSRPEGSFFVPVVAEVELKPYTAIKQQYDKATNLIEIFVRRYPAIYAISREGKSTTTAAFAGIGSPQKARKQLGVALWQLIKDIKETQVKLNEGDLDPLDLTPIHEQLFSGQRTRLGTNWQLQLPKEIAKELVKDHNFWNALKTLGLQSLSAALFLLAPFTGGASLGFALAGLAVTGYQAYRSTASYETLAQAAKTSAVPGTELVSQQQVEEAKMQMEADKVAFALAAITVGTMAAGKLMAAIKRPPVKIAAPKEAAPAGAPKQLGPGPEPPKQLGPGPEPSKQLGPGPEPPKQLGPGPEPLKQVVKEAGGKGLRFRPDVILKGGRSGSQVKNLTGPPSSIVKGASGRVFVTNDKGQIIFDITKDRVKPVTPGGGFGDKRPPTTEELEMIKRIWGG